MITGTLIKVINLIHSKGTIFNQFSNVGPDLPRDEDRGYEYQSLFFVGMSVFLLFVAIALVFVDKAGGR